MQESSIVEILQAVISSGAVNDTHLFLIIGLCIVVVIKKIAAPFKDIMEKISTKTDITNAVNEINNNAKISDEHLKELIRDFKKVSDKLDLISTKAEIHSSEITNLKSDLEQIKKYIDNVYIVSLNNKK